MSNNESAAAEVVKANPAGLVGKDELGLSSILEGFTPAPTEAAAKLLLDLAGYGSESKVEGGFVRLSPDDFMVLVHHAASDAVMVIWVEEESEVKTFYSVQAGKEITFRPKRLTGFMRVGLGDQAVEQGKAVIDEVRESIELAVMRTFMGIARESADTGTDLDLAEEVDEEAEALRALMEEG